MGVACSDTSGCAKPQWSGTTPVAFGSDKEVFLGTFNGKPVAICVAKKQGRHRLRTEVQVLSQLGKHPNIVQMMFWRASRRGAYLALECVEPIGFDLDRLASQYLFAQQSVPSLLTRTLVMQLCSALDFMHGKQIIHRDLKSENVLVTRNCDAKLIDMGIACRAGAQEERWVWSAKSYFAPELCQGGRPQVEPMEDKLMEAMLGLLAFEPSDRWTTKKIQERIPPAGQSAGSEGCESWQVRAVARADTRRMLHRYKGHAPPLSAYAAVVDGKSRHLIGKRVDELGLRRDHGAILLLVDVPGDAALKRRRALEKSPKRDTVIEDGAWLYFGLPPRENTEEAVVGLKSALFPCVSSQIVGRSVNATAGLMAFTLEFDCFQFPRHIGSKAAIGRSADPGVTALDLRGNFGLNLAGIMRAKSKEPEWFPGPDALVEPGDLGLIVRCPCRDGTTEPTICDEQMQPLMDHTLFDKAISGAAGTDRRTDGHASRGTDGRLEKANDVPAAW